MLIFENSLKSDKTRKIYVYQLNKFVTFCNVKDYDGLANMDQSELQIMVEDYVMYLKKKISPNTINVPLSAIKAFLECNDIELRWSKIKRLTPAKIKKTGSEAWLTEEINQMLLSTSEIRTKALIHFIASSGIRIGGLENLELRHITQIENCRSLLIYEGTTEEYRTFLTSEESVIFDKYLQKRESDGEKLLPIVLSFV